MKNKFLKILSVFAVGVICFALSFAFTGVADVTLKIAGVALVIIATINLLPPRHDEPVNPEYRYKVRTPFMSAPERAAYELLVDALPEYEIFPQIALVSVIDKTNAAYRGELFRVVDFCAFTKDLTPVLAVELNDASHNRADRKARDEKVKCILDRAGLPLLTLTLDDLSLDARYLRKKAKSLINK